MEYINNSLCATRGELVPSIITGVNLQNLVLRKQVKIVVRGCRGRQAQYAVDSLPKKYREECYKRFDIPPMPREKSRLEELISPYPEAVRFYHAYRLPDGRCLPQERISQYTAEAQILEAISAYWMEHTSVRGKGGARPVGKGTFYGWMVDQLGAISTSDYPHKLPQSVDNLKRKHARYKLEGLESLVHKGYNNRNASKVEQSEQEAYLLMLLAHQNQLTNRQVAKLYNEVASQRGWEHLTTSAVAKIAKKHDLLLEAGRMGATKFRANARVAIRRSKPSRSMSYWVLDGWEAELYYQQTTERKGTSHTRYDCRLVVVVVLDASCSYPIGYAIGDRESKSLITQALMSAVHHTETLFGARLAPRQLQMDNYDIKELMPLYASMAGKVTPAQAKNARAKIVEPYFSYLNTQYCKLQPNWAGYGVVSAQGKNPNTDALNALKHSTPTKEEVISQIHLMIAEERAKKQAEYLELYDGDLTGIELSREVYLENFGLRQDRLIGQSIYGLTPTIYGETRYYECLDLGWRQQKHQKWQVCYDPSELSTVLAISEDGQYKYLLTEKHVQPMALEDQTAQDAQELKKVRDFEGEVESWIQSKYEEIRPVALEVAEGSPTAHRLLQHTTLPFKGGKGKKSTKAKEQEAPAPQEVANFTPTREVMILDNKGRYKDHRYDRKLEREGLSSASEEAPQRRRSILERV
nr:MAG TPA: transposase [Caudoviricetes sp.]